jgi:hypothetical protein
VEAEIPYLKLKAAAGYISRNTGVMMTADEVLLAGVTGDLTICAYFVASEMYNQTTKQVEPFTSQFLAIPPYSLKEIEARGRATINYATDTAGNTLYSPLVDCTRDQLRVLAGHANELIARLIVLQAAAVPETVAPKAEPNPQSRTSPQGITKGQAIAAFGSIVRIDLKSALEDGKKWILSARLSKGAPGGKYPSVWCPVKLAVCLYAQHRVEVSQLNKVFRNYPFLAPWRDEWREKAELM